MREIAVVVAPGFRMSGKIRVRFDPLREPAPAFGPPRQSLELFAHRLERNAVTVLVEP